MATTALSVVLKDIEEKIETLTRAIKDGVAKDYSEYKSMTGEIRGLSLAHSFVSDLAKNLEFDDE